MKRFFAVICLLTSTQILAAPMSNYAGQQNREIKSLSQSDIEGYLAGKGMGLAKAAELNGYPGPRHVLDLSEQLKLTSEQIQESNALFDSMQTDSKKLGADLIDLERQLDHLFANEEADQAKLKALLLAIGEVQSRIRYAHLAAHIEQKKILTPQQIVLYEQYRGYMPGHSGHSQHDH